MTQPTKNISFFKRHLFLSLLGTILLVTLSMGTHFLVTQASRESRLGGFHDFGADMMSKLLKKMPVDEAFSLIFKETPRGPSRHRALLLDENARVMDRSPDLSDQEIEALKFEASDLPREHSVSRPLSGIWRGGPFPPLVTRLDSSPTRYFVSFASGVLGASPESRHGSVPSPWNPILFVFIVSSLSVLLSFAVLVVYLQKNSARIEEVIASIRGGNLKARFKVKKLDEIGQLMMKFNEMADEIEELVERIRGGERNRINLVQELGHDFRTPLASLKNCLETLKQVKVGSDDQRELLGYSVGEVDYLTRLTDDLLFLARVDDPKYLKQGSMVNISTLLEEECERIRRLWAHKSVVLTLHNLLTVNFMFYGDPHLLKRLIRNALENAFEHATSAVTVSASLEAMKSHQFVLAIKNDGVGIPPETLLTFGEKRTRRSFEESHGKKISLGLGSVIIRAVTQAHQGTLSVENLVEGGGVVGATLRIVMPLRTVEG